MGIDVTDIYHITHIKNLRSIIIAGGLLCDADVAKGQVNAIGIAHQHIKERRAQKEVPLAPRGTLCDYVPFYFAPRSPMLYSIHKGYVDGYDGSQNEIIYLVSSVDNISASNIPFVFTDGHAVMAISQFYNDLDDLERIDWNIMRAKYWRDTLEDLDKKRRRQAEFLVYSFLPWNQILQIGTRLQTVERQVQAIIEQTGHPHQPNVSVKFNWYYN
jgi:hypothetical protein